MISSDPVRDASQDITGTTSLRAVGVALAVLLAFAFVVAAADATAERTGIANLVIPAALLLIGSVGAVTMFVRHPLIIWTPMPWFLSTCSVYFGVGALLNALGNADSVEYAGAFYLMRADELFRTNLLNVVSLLVIVIVYILTARTRTLPLVSDGADKPMMDRVILVLSIVGFPAKYLLSIPYNMGLLHFTLPGIVGGCAMFAGVVLLLLCFRVASGERRYMPWAVALGFLELTSSLLTFSKLSILFSGLMVVLGIHTAKRSPKVLAVGALALVVTYAITVPFVSFCRTNLALGSNVDVEARAHVVGEYVGSTAATNNETQSWWIRLNYSNAQAFAMALYDKGLPGETMKSAVYSLVPRFVWPDKPIMTPGREFNYLATGSDQTSTAPGIFAEAYWNGGWPLVVGGCCYIGILFAALARAGTQAMARYDFRWLPCGAFSILMGIRPDDWFVTTYFSGVVTALIYLAGAKILIRERILPAELEEKFAGEI